MEQLQTKFRVYNTLRDKFAGNEILFELPMRVYFWYVHNVKNNENTNYDEARKKLSRNIYLAKQSKYDNGDGRLYFFYGNMVLCLSKKEDENYEISYINNPPRYFRLYKDIEYRTYLNERFSISENEDSYKNNDIHKALEEFVYVTEDDILN